MLPRLNGSLAKLAAKFSDRPTSPYALDAQNADGGAAISWLRSKSIFFDGVLKGDYSLAVVNRHLTRALLKAGLEVVLYTPEENWEHDAELGKMPDVRQRLASVYPARGAYDIHLRNTWPPKADDMVGRQLNAYVCFAWEETHVPTNIVSSFNSGVDTVMVTSNFVEASFRRSGLTIPVAVVGNGTDHVLEMPEGGGVAADVGRRRDRILHVSSCFPRKGADLLVSAFAQSFRESDPVELVIKTFDNPHSTIAEDVAAAREKHRDAAPMEIIKRSLTSHELFELMRTSKLLVAPSRGEGFGLPLAEAMLLGLPVVTTNFSGQTDFCTDRTAWMVGCTLAPSGAHVAEGGSQWGDPDVLDLERQMRRALAAEAESRAKTTRGAALLKEHFKWSDVVRRIAQSLRSADKGKHSPASVPNRLSIDLVSTWSQICGISTYAEHLFATPALKPALSRVLARELRADRIASRSPERGGVVIRPWGYDRQGIDRLIATLLDSSSNVTWIQHHSGFFSNEDMNAITAALHRSSHKVKAITLHDVPEVLKEGDPGWLSGFAPIFVHTPDDAALLSRYERRPVHVIPHGILDVKRSALINPTAVTVGTFGFLAPHKNIPLLVEAFAQALSVAPHLRLKILCCTRRETRAWIERSRVETLIGEAEITDVVERDYRFLADEEIVDRLNQCDLLCFPYGPSNESATGAVRIALAADRPILCSESSVLRDIRPLALILPDLTAAKIAEALVVSAAHPEIRSLKDLGRRKYTEQHAYSKVAELYAKALVHTLKEHANV